jgi:NAD(P)H dehydrogenase (quinone)
MLNLITPMLHQGMILVGLPGNIPENALYGSYYGVGITCPVESSELISRDGLELGRALGESVAKVTKTFTNQNLEMVSNVYTHLTHHYCYHCLRCFNLV